MNRQYKTGIFAYMRENEFARGALALDEDLVHVAPESPSARCWCAVGWIMRHEIINNWNPAYRYYYRKLVKKVAFELGYNSISQASDNLGWRFVTKLAERGI